MLPFALFIGIWLALSFGGKNEGKKDLPADKAVKISTSTDNINDLGR